MAQNFLDFMQFFCGKYDKIVCWLSPTGNPGSAPGIHYSGGSSIPHMGGCGQTSILYKCFQKKPMNSRKIWFTGIARPERPTASIRQCFWTFINKLYFADRVPNSSFKMSWSWDSHCHQCFRRIKSQLHGWRSHDHQRPYQPARSLWNQSSDRT